MKRILRLSLVSLLLTGTAMLYADDCSDAFNEAKQTYNAGNYGKAKELFKYVQSECGATYNGADKWIQKCNQAINPSTTLSVSKKQIKASAGSSSEYITVSSNKPWSIDTDPASWCQVSKSGSGITITISSNPNTYARATSLQIKTSDGKRSETIRIDQAAKQVSTTTTGSGSSTGSSSGSSAGSSTTGSSSGSSSAYLSLGKTSVYASKYGTTEYISVNSDRPWEIQYASGSMYSVTRISDSQVKVVINQNTGAARNDYFNIKTTDGSKTVKVSLSQDKGGVRRYGGYTALEDFKLMHGDWEVDWAGFRMNLCTGFEFEMSTLAFRYSVLKVEPIILGLRYDFLEDYGSFYYQPDIKLVFPWDDDWAVEFGAGPSINVDLSKRGSYYSPVWFTTEVGVLWHWGDVCSSDFFLRYDGMFVFGASINFSTGF
jgi:hypothetical protein